MERKIIIKKYDIFISVNKMSYRVVDLKRQLKVYHSKLIEKTEKIKDFYLQTRSWN